MTHDGWTDRLSDYVDREMPEGERLALEAHLAGCEACQDTVAVLRAVQRRAARLPDRGPREDLWPAIAALIGNTASAVADPAVLPMVRRRRFAFTIPQLAAAGIALVTLAGGSTWLALRSSGPGTEIVTPAPSAPAMAPGGTLVRNASLEAERTYDAAVADLQTLLDAGRDRLDPQTVRVLEQNLAAIDSAVADAQRAIAADPANAYLNTHLARTMRRKIDLLRHAATLASARS